MVSISLVCCKDRRPNEIDGKIWNDLAVNLHESLTLPSSYEPRTAVQPSNHPRHAWTSRSANKKMNTVTSKRPTNCMPHILGTISLQSIASISTCHLPQSGNPKNKCRLVARFDFFPRYSIARKISSWRLKPWASQWYLSMNYHCCTTSSWSVNNHKLS